MWISVVLGEKETFSPLRVWVFLRQVETIQGSSVCEELHCLTWRWAQSSSAVSPPSLDPTCCDRITWTRSSSPGWTPPTTLTPHPPPRLPLDMILVNPVVLPWRRRVVKQGEVLVGICVFFFFFLTLHRAPVEGVKSSLSSTTQWTDVRFTAGPLIHRSTPS